MVSTLSIDNNGKIVLTSREKGGKAREATTEQTQAWMISLASVQNPNEDPTKLSQDELQKRASKTLSQYEVAVPDVAGDSQYRTGYQLGLNDRQIQTNIVDVNQQYAANPNLIQKFDEGDVDADFVYVAKSAVPEPQRTPNTEPPAAQPKPDTSSPQAFGSSLLDKAPDQATRNKWISDYINGAEKPKDVTEALLKLDYGKDNAANRQQIIRAYVKKVAGDNGGEQLKTLRALAEHDWKNGNNQSIDVQIDTDILAVAKELKFSRGDIPNINKDVKD
ncbi:hypothetical protein ACFW16_16535 [Inquilinus sp. NPDC058860]|uniref:hypothetical protein n=1 Tax=Inquilinus sp. NPDC058860 TaxID=3346652 RepID=UPI00368699C7